MKKYKTFVKELEDEMGAKVVMLVGYKNVEGAALSSRYIIVLILINMANGLYKL